MDKPERDADKAKECTEFFCATLANLNKVYEGQLDALLKLAIAIAEAYRSLSSCKPDEEHKGAAGTTADELAALVEKLRSGTEASNPKDIGQLVEASVGSQSAIDTSDAFCAIVEGTLINAMKNSVSAQQQLFISGQAILNMGAAKLLSISAKKE